MEVLEERRELVGFGSKGFPCRDSSGRSWRVTTSTFSVLQARSSGRSVGCMGSASEGEKGGWSEWIREVVGWGALCMRVIARALWELQGYREYGNGRRH